MFMFISVKVCIHTLAADLDIPMHQRIEEYVFKLRTDIVGAYKYNKLDPGILPFGQDSFWLQRSPSMQALLY